MTIPIIYKSNETDFSTWGLGPLSDEASIQVIEERNGQFYMEMEYPVDGLNFSELRLERLIKTNASPTLRNQRFRIIRITKPAKGMVKVYAEHISNILSDLQLLPQLGYNGDAMSAFRSFDYGILGDYNPFTYYSNITSKALGVWETDKVDNARKALGGVEGSMLDAYGGEFRFDNFRIELYKERGSDNNIPIMYGKNLVDMEQEEEIATMYTSVFPYAFHTYEDDDEPTLLTLPEYFLDSFPAGANVNRRTIKMDFSGGDYNVESVADLRDVARQFMLDNDIGSPKVNLKIKFVDLVKTLDYKDRAKIESIELCDWVDVYFEKLEVWTRAKIIKTTFNPTLDRYEEIEIGDVRANLTHNIKKSIDSKLEFVETDLEFVRASANGKNRNFWSATEPTSGMQKNDNWFKRIANGEEEIWRYDGEKWVFISSTADVGKNKKAIEEMQEDLDLVRDTAEKSLKELEDAINASGFTSLEELTESLSGASSRAEANAQEAKTNAYNALMGAQEALGTIEGVETRFSSGFAEIEDELSRKASKQIVDGLTGTVETFDSRITHNAEGINLKASKSDVEALEGLVEVLDADFSVLAGQISSRVSKTELKGAIDNIKIGNRNLLVNSQNGVILNDNTGDNPSEKEVLEDMTAVWLPSGGNHLSLYSTRLIDIDSLGEYIHSVKVMTEGADINIGVSGGGDTFPIKGDGTWHTIYRINDYTSLGNKRSIGINSTDLPIGQRVYYKEFQVVKGNMLVDWSPAPEDALEVLYAVESNWVQTHDTILSEIADSEGRINHNVQTLENSISAIAGPGGRLSVVEQTADGLQSTIKDKVSQAQMTQLSNAFQLKVDSIASWTEEHVVNSNIPARLVDINGEDLDKDTSYEISARTLDQQITTGVLATLNSSRGRWTLDIIKDYGNTYYHPRLYLDNSGYPHIRLWGDTNFRKVSITINESGMQDSSQLSILSDQINLKVSEGDLLSQINLESDNILIESKKLHLSAESVVFSGKAFIPGAKIEDASIDNAKIEDATISSAKISFLDVSKLSGGISSFIQTNWNSINGNVQIDGAGINMMSAGTWRRNILDSTGIILYNDAGGTHKAGTIGYFKEHYDSAGWGEAYFRGNNRGSSHYVGIGVNNRHDFAVGYQSDNSINRRYDKVIQIDGDTGLFRHFGRITSGGSSNYTYTHWAGQFRGEYGVGLFGGNLDQNGIHFGINNFVINAHNAIEFYAEGNKSRMSIRDSIIARSNIFLNGWDIHGHSDRRDKKHIKNVESDSLSAIRGWNFVNFEWKSETHQKGVQFGLIAQDTPEIEMWNESTDTYSINTSKQLMLTTHGLQQLSFMHEETVAKVLTNEQQIKRLEHKVRLLEGKVNELEGEDV